MISELLQKSMAIRGSLHVVGAENSSMTHDLDFAKRAKGWTYEIPKSAGVRLKRVAPSDPQIDARPECLTFTQVGDSDEFSAPTGDVSGTLRSASEMFDKRPIRVAERPKLFA